MNKKLVLMFAGALLAVPAFTVPSAHAVLSGFKVEGFNIVGGGGSNDNDLNSTNETISIWNALDNGVGPTGPVSVPQATNVNGTYNFQNIHTGVNNAVVNYGGGGGNFGGNVGYGTIGGGLGGDDFSVRATAAVTFNNAGTYRIAAASDDGRLVNLTGAVLNSVSGQTNIGGPGASTYGWTNPTGHNNSTGEFTVNAGDVVNVESFFFERGGGDSFEISVASGAGGACCGGFTLLQNGALAGGITMGNWNVEAFNITNAGGATDHDLNSTAETLALWNAVDNGATVGANVVNESITLGSTNYNIANYVIDNEAVVDLAGGGGNFPTNNAYASINSNGPGGGGGPITGGDDYSFRAQADLTFGAGGTYSIGAASDDGRILTLSDTLFSAHGGQIDGGSGTGTNFLLKNGTSGHANSVGVFTIGANQTLSLSSLFFERGGGDSFEIFIKQGSDTGMGGPNDGWVLLQDGVFGIRVTEPQVGGVPEPATALLGIIGLGALGMRRRRDA
jgi:MYXO-CTERM domain-containing protein